MIKECAAIPLLVKKLLQAQPGLASWQLLQPPGPLEASRSACGSHVWHRGDALLDALLSARLLRAGRLISFTVGREHTERMQAGHDAGAPPRSLRQSSSKHTHNTMMYMIASYKKNSETAFAANLTVTWADISKRKLF